MTQPDYRGRTAELLRRASQRVTAECKAMHAQHAAKGALQSGATMVRAVEIWSEISSEHLKIALAEFGATIETRGREWKRAMRGAQGALNGHSAAASELLEPSFRLANPPGGTDGAAYRAADDRISAAHEKMTLIISDFRDGWTAPRAKKWNERNPLAFALLMAGVGALLATAARLLFK